jgi:homoaconitase/3-isopropylmalate dehydratase large subunit
VSNSESSGIDFVRELRLRNWARQNFVPGDQRKSTWHPIVLDEMNRRDMEITLSIQSVEPIAAAPVAVDSAIPVLQPEPIATESYMSLRHSGSNFVPLPPTSNWEIHAGTSEIPSPHFARDTVHLDSLVSY